MKHNYKQMLMLCLLMIPFLLTGCHDQLTGSQNKDTLHVYFYNPQNGGLEEEEVKVTLDNHALGEEKMQAVLQALYKGPQSGNQVAKPMDFHIKQSALKEHVAYITFKESYNALSTQAQIAIRVSLVYSLTDLDFIDAVEFYIEDKPLTTSYGTKVGAVARKDMLISGLNPSPPTLTQTITLYFAKANDDKLYKEERTININNNTPIEEYVIAELIKGPTGEGLLPTLPPDTRVNEIKTQELICQVDLSYNLKNTQFTSPLQEKLVIYSIVNSLTENPKVQKVVFLMDGKKQTEFASALDAGGLFERNEEIIANTP